MKTLKLNEDDIWKILNALKYVGNNYLKVVADLVQIDPDHSNNEILQRSYDYQDLAAKIEKVSKEKITMTSS